MGMFSHRNSIIRKVRHLNGIIINGKKKSTVDYVQRCFSHASVNKENNIENINIL